MLTISRLKRFGIAYYNDTADQAKEATMDRRKANGGLAEYYSEGETRAPTWLIVGDTGSIGETTGLTEAALHGGEADTETARIWLDDGRTPNDTHGRAFTDKSVHGFDLTLAAPTSVSLIRALTDDIAEKALGVAHTRAVDAAMAYLHQHAGYTRVHNPINGMKDLQRLPGLVAIAYQHETSRCGEPHLHTHVIVPNRQPRADGQLVSLDSKSLYHETKAAGMIYQATLRRILHAERGFEWQPVDPHTGMAEIAGVTTETIKAWSQRSTRLREWASNNLVLVDGQPTAAQLAAAQIDPAEQKGEPGPVIPGLDDVGSGFGSIGGDQPRARVEEDDQRNEDPAHSRGERPHRPAPLDLGQHDAERDRAGREYSGGDIEKRQPMITPQ
jgi:conjugative relaxase-like TrwC/TraI family protein